MYYRIHVLSLIFLLSLGFNYQNVSSEVQLNQVVGKDSSSAIPLAPGDHYLNTMPGPSFNDGYWFVYDLGTTYQSGDYDFRLEVYDEAGTNFDIEIYDANLDFVDQATGPYYPEFVQIDSLQGIHYIHTLPTSGTGDFDFYVTEIGLRGDGPTNAMNLILKEPKVGLIPGPAVDESMYYQIDIGYIAGATMYSISLDADASTNFDLYLTDTSMTPISSSTTTTYPEMIQMDPSSLFGTFIVQVAPVSGTGEFTINFDNSIPPGFDAENAIPITPGEIVTGQTPTIDDLTDLWYAVELGNAGVPEDYLVSLTGDPGTGFVIEIWDENESFLTETTPPEYEEYPQTVVLADYTGTHYVHIQNFYSSTDGGFSFSVEPFVIPGSTPESAIPLDLTGPIDFYDMPGPASDDSYYFSAPLTKDSFYGFEVQATPGKDVLVGIFDEGGSKVGELDEINTREVLELVEGDYTLNVASTDDTTRFGLLVEEIPLGSDPSNPRIWAGVPFTLDFNGGYPWVEWIFADFGPGLNTYSISAECESGSGQYDTKYVKVYDADLNPVGGPGWDYCFADILPVEVAGPIYLEIIPDDFTLSPITIGIECTTCVLPSVFLGEFRNIESGEYVDCNDTYTIFVDIVWENLDPSTVIIAVVWSVDGVSYIDDLDPFSISGTGSQTVEAVTVKAVSDVFKTHFFAVTVKLNGDLVNEEQITWNPQCIGIVSTITTTDTDVTITSTTVITTDGTTSTTSTTITNITTTGTTFSTSLSVSQSTPLLFFNAFIMSTIIMIRFSKRKS